VLLVAGIFLIQAMVWIAVFRWVKMKTEALKSHISAQASGGTEGFVIGPKSALFRGSDARFGNVKGNGVICLTENRLLFEKLTGQRIELNRAEIVSTTVEKSFKGKLSFGTGGRHLVITTKDGNRIGFLVRDAETWSEKINVC
ncbi:MAG: hypothetical protein WAU91_16235, partial [Desulfatitalea sp.]